MIDRIVSALRDGPGSCKEVAARIGTVPCHCDAGSYNGSPHWCATRDGRPGWRTACYSDVYPELQHAVKAGLIGRDTIDHRVIYSAVSIDLAPCDRVIREMEAEFQ